MPLYQKIETDKSFEYLQKIADILEEPICILGGWAVYYTVNDFYKKDKGPNYLGSKDIDLGFHLDTNLDKNKLINTTIGTSIKTLDINGFIPQGFRYYKDINVETGKELTPEESKKEQTHNIFKIYVDLLVDEIHPNFEEIFGFVPADEPLLSLVFLNKKKRRNISQFNHLLWLPMPEILLATKIISLPKRTKDEKLIKDICDIYALSFYSGEKVNKLINKTFELVNTDNLEKLRPYLKSDKEFIQAGESIQIEAEAIKNLFKELIQT
jgi:hypothetical protein